MRWDREDEGEAAYLESEGARAQAEADAEAEQYREENKLEALRPAARPDVAAGERRCNRCANPLCEHDNCTAWKCARACSKCVKWPEGESDADGILKRIALRYKNCMVNIYPDLPELTPVEGVLRCAAEEGFVLVARPDVAGGASAEQAEQDKIGRLTGSKCIEALASRREASLAQEREKLLDAYYQDQGVAPDGELRPLVSKLLKRVEAAEALASRREIGEGRLATWESDAAREIWAFDAKGEWPDSKEAWIAHVTAIIAARAALAGDAPKNPLDIPARPR